VRPPRQEASNGSNVRSAERGASMKACAARFRPRIRHARTASQRDDNKNNFCANLFSGPARRHYHGPRSLVSQKGYNKSLVSQRGYNKSAFAD
jgi:hypothetical protein